MSGNPPSPYPWLATPWRAEPCDRDGKWVVLDARGRWVATVATEEIATRLVELSEKDDDGY